MLLRMIVAVIFAFQLIPHALAQNNNIDQFDRREILLFIPSHLPPNGQRALVVALHGGGGNASFMQNHLDMNAIAEKQAFIVAYFNGTHAGRLLPPRMLAWNAGGECCGLPYRVNVDDVNYIAAAVHYLAEKYGIDSNKIYAIGHSNGAMMAQRLMCETNLFRASVVIAGPLNTDAKTCPLARGKQILSLHGIDDLNVPVNCGKGSKGVTNIAYHSEAETKQIFEASGAVYTLVLLKSDHALTHINDAISQNEHITLAEKAARFFGLMN